MNLALWIDCLENLNLKEEGEGTKISMRQHRVYETLVLLSIVLFGLVFRVLVYTRHPYSYGIDGPYYNLQVQSVLEDGPYIIFLMYPR